ncbi:unnamed protein product [Spirodela intermedia]|uniref:Uncharacterized protein n=1 Tax=Spirodela intermedia TaxID=51605 RepID=A0A7I8KF04_SPIIN|nr:unnamed protein product [Spirodela intermedia]
MNILLSPINVSEFNCVKPFQGQLPTIEEEEFKPKTVGNDDYIE